MQPHLRQREGQGIFITFEGGEGAGKSTQIRLLAQHLEQAGIPAWVTREPGGTPLAEKIRHILVTGDPSSMTATTELLLMVAARSAHVHHIRQHMARGVWVLCDRFGDSSLAYQGYGRGLDTQWIRQLNHWATQGLTPHITFLLDIDTTLGLTRAHQRQGGEDRFEQEQQAFHERVRQGFLQLAAEEPGRFHLLDASQPPESLAQHIWQEVTHAFSRL